MAQAIWWTVIRVVEPNKRRHQFVRKGKLTDKEIEKVIRKYERNGVIKECALAGKRHVFQETKPTY
jgi:hypothetical protein